MTETIQVLNAVLPWGCIILIGWFSLCCTYKLIALVKDLTSKIIAIENAFAYHNYLAQEAQEQGMASNGMAGMRSDLMGADFEEEERLG